jgi:putative membrane protein
MSDLGTNHIKRAIKHYGALFTFPTYSTLVMFQFVIGTIGGGLALSLSSFYFPNFVTSALLSVCIFVVPSIIGDILIKTVIIPNEPVFNLRRCAALSLITSTIWIGTIIIGAIIAFLSRDPRVLVRTFLLGFSAVLVLRFLAFYTISFSKKQQNFFAATVQPILCLAVAFFLQIFSLSLLIPLLGSSIILLIASYAFFKYIDRHGKEKVGLSAVSLFRGFVADWTENLNAPLEECFEKLSSDDDISITIAAFRSNSSSNTLLVIPSFHPGPFRNVGSSGLPYELQRSLEAKTGAMVFVTHGTSGHELDLASQKQNLRIIEETLKLVTFKQFLPFASSMIRAEVGYAKASCQILGDGVLLTLTCAPKTMEDIPREVSLPILDAGKKLLFKTIAVIDAHNSIDAEAALSDAEIEALVQAAKLAMGKVVNEPRSKLQIGVAKVVPPEYTIRQGVGLGGIVVLVIKVGQQTVAYITIDGNNMVTGLREKILSSLQEIGISDGEVLTTDTHAVNAVTLTPRGYYPVGEAVDQQQLIYYIKEAAKTALSNLKDADISWNIGMFHNVRVIGSKRLSELTDLVDSTINLAKKAAIVFFCPASILAILFFILL